MKFQEFIPICNELFKNSSYILKDVKIFIIIVETITAVFHIYLEVLR